MFAQTPVSAQGFAYVSQAACDELGLAYREVQCLTVLIEKSKGSR